MNTLLIFVSLCLIILLLIILYKYNSMRKKLMDQDDLIHTFSSNIEDVFTVYTPVQHRFEYISPNFEHVLGFNSNALHRNINALFDYAPPEKKEEYIKHFTLSRLNEYKELGFEYLHPKEKEPHWLNIRFYPVVKNNTVIRYISWIREETKEYHARLAMKEALEVSLRANEAKKEFMSHICHEIKTPISNIIGITQLARNYISDNDKVARCLEKIDFSSNNLLNLVHSILDMAKIDCNKLILMKEPFSINSTVTDFFSVIHSLAEINNINCKLLLPSSNHDTLVGDSLRLTQILGNCLSNSIKYTPAGGSVTLEVLESESAEKECLYQFQICDTGRGMDSDYIQRIFEPFDQENPLIDSRYGGSGLGMTITKKLVDLMGGTIVVQSKTGEGTKITIDIRFQIADSSEKVIKDYLCSTVVEYDFRDMRILLVEDNEISQEIVTEYLESMNILVDTAASGYTAVRRFEASEEGYYSIILMDVQMPDISGYEAVRFIRASKHPQAGQITIIAMSADNFDPDFSCILSGVNYYISKPIDRSRLYSLLHSISQKAN